MPRDAGTVGAVISDLRHRISQARDVLNNDEYYFREVERLQTNISALQKQLDALTNLRANGLDLIDGWKAQLQELAQGRRMQENAADINKLIKLQEKLNATETG